MTFDLTLSEGSYLVKLARRAIEASFARKKADMSDAPRRRGRSAESSSHSILSGVVKSNLEAV